VRVAPTPIEQRNYLETLLVSIPIVSLVIFMGNNRYVTFSCSRVVYMTYLVISMGNNKSNCEEVSKELAPSNKPNRVQNDRVRQRVKATGTEPRLHMEAIKAAKAQKAWPLTAFRYEPCVCTLDYIDATTQMITNTLALETCSQENIWQCFHSSSVSIIAIEPNFSALDMIFI
jgi:hypothetical protein